MSLSVVVILIFFGLPILGVILLLGYGIHRTTSESRDPELRQEEARELQTLHRELERMEKRIEALETLLIERSERKDEA
jgi:phage shock protein B